VQAGEISDPRVEGWVIGEHNTSSQQFQLLCEGNFGCQSAAWSAARDPATQKDLQAGDDHGRDKAIFSAACEAAP
jgi:hypothetical protein